MFENTGYKLKFVAKIFAWGGIGASALLGIAVMFFRDAYANEIELLFGLLIAVIGCLLSWISSLVIYGFGQLIENSDKLISKHEASTVSKVNN